MAAKCKKYMSVFFDLRRETRFEIGNEEWKAEERRAEVHAKKRRQRSTDKVEEGCGQWSPGRTTNGDDQEEPCKPLHFDKQQNGLNMWWNNIDCGLQKHQNFFLRGLQKPYNSSRIAAMITKGSLFSVWFRAKIVKI
uniref:Uncharacterized protein n=1 Tax=Romanomermis culicivorax TaxID=13658 RepID=A0A915KJT4_ROMCU